MGYEVSYSAYLDDGVGIFDNEDRLLLKTKFPCKHRFFIKAFQKDYLVGIAKRFLKNKRFDFCLLRINYVSKAYFDMLKLMKANGAFVMMESLSYYPNIDVRKINKASYRLISKSLQRHKNDLKDVVDLMLTEGVIDDFYGVPCVEFGMGIDVELYNEHKYQGDPEELNLLMVGCDSIYHGTDRLLKSAGVSSRKGIKFKIHLVGDLLPKDKKLIKKLGLGSSVICYGRKTGKELDSIFDKCNIALGPLAQHRIGKKDTGLKTKEYFARGIPYIYTGHEINIPEDFQYIKKIDDSEELIDLDCIHSFYKSLAGLPVVSEMRKMARSAFSWQGIFIKAFEQASTILSNKEA